jgi:hypothetical protein
MFKPEEIIFAPTAQCNLACGHCRVTRIPQELQASTAVSFMESCRGRGVERIGFSGGEPFLRPDFLHEVCQAAVDMEYYFGRLMTNGCWADDSAGYSAALEPLYDAGFDGKFGLSFDSWHGNDAGRAADFLKAVFRIWDRRDIAEILAVNPPGQDTSAEAADEAALKALAAGLGGSFRRELVGSRLRLWTRPGWQRPRPIRMTAAVCTCLSSVFRIRLPRMKGPGGQRRGSRMITARAQAMFLCTFRWACGSLLWFCQRE